VATVIEGEGIAIRVKGLLSLPDDEEALSVVRESDVMGGKKP